MESNPELTRARDLYERASALFRQYWDAVYAVAQGPERERTAIECEQQVGGLVLAGLYEHWKSRENEPKFYIVFHCGIERGGTRQPFVAYTQLYGETAGCVKFLNLLDPAEGFLAPVEKLNRTPPYVGPRFTLRRTLTGSEIAKINAGDCAKAQTSREVVAMVSSQIRDEDPQLSMD